MVKNDIDRDISMVENDIDRNISLAKNYIDREGIFEEAKQGFVILDNWVIPCQSTEIFRTRPKNIFFHEKPQIYIILRYLNLFFNTFCVLGAFFHF